MYAGPGGWHFVTLPTNQAEAIKSLFQDLRRGWGSVPVHVTIGRTSWNTSLFPDRASGSYLLPVKAAVRNKEGITDGDSISLKIHVPL